MKATWNGVVVAESDDTVLMDGNHYFPESALKREFVTFSNHKTMCPRKGQATYLSLLVQGELNPDAAWTVGADTLRSQSKFTPFEGQTLQGRVTHTLVGGPLAFTAAAQ